MLQLRTESDPAMHFAFKIISCILYSLPFLSSYVCCLENLYAEFTQAVQQSPFITRTTLIRESLIKTEHHTWIVHVHRIHIQTQSFWPGRVNFSDHHTVPFLKIKCYLLMAKPYMWLLHAQFRLHCQKPKHLHQKWWSLRTRAMTVFVGFRLFVWGFFHFIFVF